MQQSGALGCTAEVFIGRTRPPYPPVINDEGAYHEMQRVATEILGEENVIRSPPSMYAEDFAMYLERIPGAFMFIGVSNATRDPLSDLHTPYFYANEDVLPVGAAFHTSLAISYLQQQQQRHPSATA